MAGKSGGGGDGGGAMKEIPFSLIQDAAKTYETCLLRVTRRNQKGQLQTVVPNFERQVIDMLDIEQHLIQIGGGGHYRVELRNPKQGVEPMHIVPPFMVHIEAPPKPVTPAADTPAGFVPPMHGMAGMAPQVGGGMAWGAGLSPQQQQSYFGQMPGGQQMWGPYGPPPPPWARPNGGNGTKHQADEVALRQVADLKEQLGKLAERAEEREKRYEEERRRWEEREREKEREHEREMQRLREERDRDREAAREREREEDRRRHDERFRELQLQLVAPKKTAAEELAPILERLLGEGRTSRSDEMQLQLKLFEMQQTASQNQMQMMQTMLLKAGSGDKETMLLLKEMMNQKSPEMQAALIQQMLEMQITSVGAMANLVKETMPDQPPVWLQAIMGGLDRVGQMAEDYIQSGQQRPVQHGQIQQVHQPRAPQQFQPQPQPLPPQPGGSDVEDEPHVVVIDAIGEPMPPQGVPDAQDLEQSVNAAMNIKDDAERLAAVEAKIDQLGPMLPSEFRTREWRAILVELHVQRPPERVAHLLTRQLTHLLDFRGLPSSLAKLTEEPEKTLEGIVRYLPIAQQDPEYVAKVIELTVSYLEQEQYLQAGAEPQPEAVA